MYSKVQYQGQLLNGLSPRLWQDCPLDDLRSDNSVGFCIVDDFIDFAHAGGQFTAQTFIPPRYKAIAPNASGSVRLSKTIGGSTIVNGGVLTLRAGANNAQAAIAHCHGLFRLSGSGTNSGKLWFEARIALSSLVTDGGQLLVGLAEVSDMTFDAAVPLADNDGVSNAGAFLGFRRAEDGLTAIQTVYNDRAATLTQVGSSQAAFAAANQFTKLGLLYDPGDAERCIRFYQNNQELPVAIPRSTITGTTNFKNGLFAPVFAFFADSAGAAFEAYIDWWACAQLRV